MRLLSRAALMSAVVRWLRAVGTARRPSSSGRRIGQERTTPMLDWTGYDQPSHDRIVGHCLV